MVKADDVKRTMEQAILKAGLGKVQCPKLLSDNGACYIASELKEYLKTKGISQVHGKRAHPQTQRARLSAIIVQ
jgi:transposase InsO family protein